MGEETCPAAAWLRQSIRSVDSANQRELSCELNCELSCRELNRGVDTGIWEIHPITKIEVLLDERWVDIDTIGK
jgi:hypothetical protein